MPSSRSVAALTATLGLALSVLLSLALGGMAEAGSTAGDPGATSVITVGTDQNRITAGDGEALIQNGDSLLKAGDGCAVIQNENQLLVAGSCDGQNGDSTNPESATPEGTLSEGTLSEQTISPQESTTITEQTSLEMTSEGTTAEQTVPEGVDDICPAAPPREAVEATVTRALDGDSVELGKEVEGRDTVRLIGVDTPELEGARGESEPFAYEAAAFTAGGLEGEKVLLEIGEDPEDGHGRLLADVWSAPDDGVIGPVKRFFGAGEPELWGRALLENGYARVLTIGPNDRYRECYEHSEQQATDEGKGIWGLTDSPAEEQYEEQTALESTVTELTSPEETVAEQTTMAESTSEQTTAGGGEDEVPDDVAAEDPYGNGTRADTQQGRSGESPDYEQCDEPSYINSFSSEKDSSERIDVRTGSFLIAYRTRPLEDGEPGAFLMDVLKADDDSSVERITTEAAGTHRTYIDAGPGEFDLTAASDGFGYDVAVYGCGGKVAQSGSTEGSSDRGTQQTPHEPSTDSAIDASEPESSAGATRAPSSRSRPEVVPVGVDSATVLAEPEETAHGTPASVGARSTPEVPVGNLGVPQTGSGPLSVLPDTGGGSLLAAGAGLALVTLGLVAFRALRNGTRD